MFFFIFHLSISCVGSSQTAQLGQSCARPKVSPARRLRRSRSRVEPRVLWENPLDVGFFLAIFLVFFGLGKINVCLFLLDFLKFVYSGVDISGIS